MITLSYFEGIFGPLEMCNNTVLHKNCLAALGFRFSALANPENSVDRQS